MPFVEIAVWGIQAALLAFTIYICLPHFVANRYIHRKQETGRIISLLCFVAFGLTVSYLSFRFPEHELIPILRLFAQTKSDPIQAFAFGCFATVLLLIIKHFQSAFVVGGCLMLMTIILFPSLGISWSSPPMLAGTAGKLISVGIIASLTFDFSEKVPSGKVYQGGRCTEAEFKTLQKSHAKLMEISAKERENS